MNLLPVNPMWVGAGLGFSAAVVAFVAHMMPRVLTFAGAAVGFGVGIAAARSFPFRPTTPADDLFTLMLGVALAIVLGTFGSMAMRAAIVWVGVRRPGDAGSVHLFPGSEDTDDGEDEDLEPAAGSKARAAR
jgi:hypothetical protein